MQFTDLSSQYQLLKARIDAGMQRVLDHGKFIQGPEVRELEDRLQEFLDVRHAITCANGTDALVLALMAMGVKQGDAVFCPTFTFFASAEAIAFCGATPVFVDSDDKTFNISPLGLEKAIAEVLGQGQFTPRVVLAVDLFGLPANYPAIRETADKFQLKILEDAAQGFGGEINGVKAGACGDISITSFFPTKPLGCYGDGGAIFTDDEDYAESLRSLAQHGKGSDKYDNIRIGMNSRLDTIQAAVLLEKLRVFPEELALRGAVAKTYGESLDGIVQTPEVPVGYTSSWAQYTIRTTERDRIRTWLREKDIPAMVYYSRCMHQQTAFADSSPPSLSLETGELLAGQVLSLPFSPYMDENAILKVCDAVATCLSQG